MAQVKDTTDNLMSTQDTLLAFGEWLDGKGLIVTPAPNDARSHDDLAREFIEWWESDEGRATLAGRAMAKIGQALSELATGIKDVLDEAAASLDDLPLDERIRNGL